MAENLYLLEIAKDSRKAVAKKLDMQGEPSHLRLSTVHPVSPWGFPSGADGWALAVTDDGVIVGSDEYKEVPHMLVPWSNIVYVADGTSLSEAQPA